MSLSLCSVGSDDVPFDVVGGRRRKVFGMGSDLCRAVYKGAAPEASVRGGDWLTMWSARSAAACGSL